MREKPAKPSHSVGGPSGPTSFVCICICPIFTENPTAQRNYSLHLYRRRNETLEA